MKTQIVSNYSSPKYNKQSFKQNPVQKGLNPVEEIIKKENFFKGSALKDIIDALKLSEILKSLKNSKLN